MKIALTGSGGFIGRNLRVRLREAGFTDLVAVPHACSDDMLRERLSGVDFVYHLAGVNRPPDTSEFEQGNVGLTRRLCAALRAGGRRVPVAFTSSTQATLENSYGRSKRLAEEELFGYGVDTGSAIHVFRLPNVFGKWARPYYNSVVATFCDQVAQGMPLTIHDASATLRLVHIDDVMQAMLGLLDAEVGGGYHEVHPIYCATVGEVAQLLQEFAVSRKTLTTARVGTGLTRALYATYVSCLPPESFAYDAPVYADSRGEFVEMLKTPDCGQFSYFTARPGVTRGEHYHHSKTEKFLVIRGTARFGFRHIDSGEVHEVIVRGGEGRLVETIPGWAHNVSNAGEGELVVMLWANEIFDRARPDTIPMKVAP